MADDLIEELSNSRFATWPQALDWCFRAADALASKDAALSEMRAELERWQANWDANVQEMSEKFRAVNLAQVMAGTNLDLLARAEAAESQLEMARKALERAAIIIKEDRNTTFHCGTVRGDPATMDAPTREAIADYDAVLAEIARALADGETK